MRDTFIRLAWLTITLTVVLIVKHIKSLSWSDDFGLHWTSLQNVILWSGLFVVLLVASEIASRALGIPQPEPWGSKYSVPIKVFRVVAIVVLAPLSEELIFRGLLYKMLSKTAVGALGAIVITASLFTLFHTQYQQQNHWLLLFLILLDGLFYGVVVYFTGSVALTIMLHCLGNLYAAWERLS